MPGVADILPPVNLKAAGILRNDHALQGLTPQQELFCKLMFSGVPQVDAYRKSYNCENALPETVQHMASMAAKKPMVVARMKQLQDRWEGRAALDALISKDEVQRSIASIAFDQTAKNADRLKALDMLSKMLGLYRASEAPKDASNETLADVEAKLLDKIRQLKTAGSSSTVPVGS